MNILITFAIGFSYIEKMKKLIYIPILTTIVILFLQGLWISNIYKSFVTNSMQTVEQLVSTSIMKELTLRDYAPFMDSNRPRMLIKDADEMSSKERNSLEGDTIDLEILAQNNIGGNVNEIILQLQQDALISKGIFIELSRLDSILSLGLDEASVETNYCILLYDKDTTVIKSKGSLSPDMRNIECTRLYPIGTKGLQYIQVKADIPFSPFLREMSYILLESAILAAVVLGCVIYLMITIRRKDRIFKQREASVNGTVHELKSPLNGVITLLSFIKKKVPDDTKCLVESTIVQARNLVNEIEALLVTARQDRQKMLLHKKEVDFMRLVSDAQRTVSTQFQNKQHWIKVVSHIEVLKVEADSLYITNVLRNLIENALKYSDDDVEVVIKVAKVQERVVFAVKDNGWGIAPKYQKKIFTQFFQVPREQMAHQHGYGVGLAYVKYIMEAHGGSIRVESEPGKGSTFICELPIK